MVLPNMCIWRICFPLTLIHVTFIGFDDVEGHELFASLSSLVSLWHDEKTVVNSIEKVVQKWRDPPIEFVR